MPQGPHRKRRKRTAPSRQEVGKGPSRIGKGEGLALAAGGASSAKPRRPWMHGAVVLVLAGLCAGLYSWTADFPLEFDDHVYLVGNPLFPDPASFGYPANFVEFANRPARLGYDPDFAVNFILRPVAYWSFYLNHLGDGFNPRHYRLVNIGIHAGTAVLLYALLQVLLGRLVVAGRLARESALFISVTAALLFAAHPLATESVTYIVQRFTSLAALLSLLTLWLHFLSVQAASRRVGRTLRAGSVAAMLLAMLTKECSFVVPFLAVLLDRLVAGSAWRRAFRNALPLLACAPLIPLLVVLTAAAQNGGWLNWENCVNLVNRREDPFEHWHYLVTQATVLVHYLRLVIWPAGLNLDPEWPTYHSLGQGPVLAALAVLSSILGAAAYLQLRFKAQARAALVFVSVLWFFVTVAVSSGMVPLPDLVAEHRSYFPSIGIFILAATLLDWLRTVQGKARAWRMLVPAGTACAIAVLSWATAARNEVWRSSVGLWEDTVAKSPGKARAWGNLGTAYARAGNQEQAVACYRRSLSLEPGNQTDMRNLALSLVCLKRAREALEITGRMAEMNGGLETVPVAEIRGAALMELNRFREAAAVYRRIMAADPGHSAANMGLGIIHHRAGQPSRALGYFYRALERMPGDPRIVAAIQEAQRSAGVALR